jgi:hypothetical protein
LLLSHFSRSFLASHPSHRIVTRDVQSIPHLDYDAIEAGRTDPKLHTPEQKHAFALADELTDELVNADAIIISTPMYNWSLPSALKAWIDRVVNCRTFYLRTDTVAKIPVTFIVVSGMLLNETPTKSCTGHYIHQRHKNEIALAHCRTGGPYHLVPKMMPGDHIRLSSAHAPNRLLYCQHEASVNTPIPCPRWSRSS